MKGEKKISLRTGFIGIVIICWLMPILLTVGVAGFYMFSTHLDGKVEEQVRQFDFDEQICVERLNYLIAASKKATYDGEIEKAFQQYSKGEMTERLLIAASQQYILNIYGHDTGIREAVFWFCEDPEALNCYVCNESVSGSYSAVRTYWTSDHGGVYEQAAVMDTGIGFYENEGRIYMIRNLLSRSYKPIGVLVLRLNPDHCFGSLMRRQEDVSINVKLNDCLVALKGSMLDQEDRDLGAASRNSIGYEWEKSHLLLYKKTAEDAYQLSTYIRYEDPDSLIPLFGYQIVLIAMCILLFPLLYICIRMLHKYISAPIQEMIQGARKIEEGSLGYQLEGGAGSREFGYLMDTFNHMSAKLKEQFNYIYEEEIALRDAKIMALQSHINPHFMNNTLEIINWEARMKGCEKVSKMIESLSVLLDASIDRRKQPEVTLEEEMEYVSAYLYIISERYGDRVHVVNELPEEIMACHVPRLILQPVIENAIEHGVARKRNGTVKLQAQTDGCYLYLDIINDRVEELNERKIRQLLDINYNTSKEPSGNLGIANVNQRLHILYGAPVDCGYFGWVMTKPVHG